MSSYDDAVADWPPLNQDQKDKLAGLLRPSGRGLARIDQVDVDTVLDGIRSLGEAS